MQLNARLWRRPVPWWCDSCAHMNDVITAPPFKQRMGKEDQVKVKVHVTNRSGDRSQLKGLFWQISGAAVRNHGPGTTFLTEPFPTPPTLPYPLGCIKTAALTSSAYALKVKKENPSSAPTAWAPLLI